MNFSFLKGIAFILFTSLFGCGHSTNNDSINQSENDIANGQIKIKWLAQWKGEGKKETLIREIAREFMLLNQEYDVELEFPQDIAAKTGNEIPFLAMLDTLTGMVKAKEWPYDIMLCDAYLYQQSGIKAGEPNWGKEYLVDFKKEKWFIDAHKENLFTTDRYSNLHSGIMPGAYIEGSWIVLYVSSVIEEKLGLKVKSHDMVLDDFIAYAKAVYEYNQKNEDKITFSIFDSMFAEKIFTQLLLSEFGRNYNQNKGEIFEALKKVYDGIEEVAKYEPLNSYYIQKDNWDLKEDKILFSLNASWVSLLWQNTNPEGEKKMRPCELPSMEGKLADSYAGNYNAVFVVPKQAKNKEGAIKLMKFITSKNTAEKWVKYSKCPTGLKYKVVYAELSKDATNIFTQHIQNKYNDRLAENHLQLGKILFGLDEEIDFNSDQIMRGVMTSEQAIDSVKLQLGM